MERKNEFMTMHLSALQALKVQRGTLCLDIRTRNNLSREWVADHAGVSDRSIAKIERNYNTAIKLVNKLYRYYQKQGYISEEELERNNERWLFGE